MNVNDPLDKYIITENVTVSPNDRLLVADQLIKKNHSKHLLVQEGSTLAGILSFGDILYILNKIDNDSFEPYRNEMRLKNYKVSDVMTKDVITIQKDATVKEAIEILLEKEINALPVLQDNQVVGMITTRGLMANLIE